MFEWQKDFQKLWKERSHPDDIHNMERELHQLYKPVNTKGRAKTLENLHTNAVRPLGKYHTSSEKWTCSCPSFLISRFLLCKHLVCETNSQLKVKFSDLTLAFFASLHRHHYSPFYHISGIHNIPSACLKSPLTINALPCRTLRNSRDLEVLVWSPSNSNDTPLLAVTDLGPYGEGDKEGDECVMTRAEEHSLEDPSSDVERYEEEDDWHLLMEADGPTEETRVSKVRLNLKDQLYGY